MPLTRRADVKPDDRELTQLLRKVADGDRAAEDRLFQFVLPELRRLASRKLRGEKPGHTYRTSDLVLEAYLRLDRQEKFPSENLAQFRNIIARMMRRILIDHAKAKKSERNGGGMMRVPMDASLNIPEQSAEQILAVHEALEKLQQENSRQAKIVELRFFGGLSNEEVAESLGVSLSTVEADWRWAKARLREMLGSCP
jgi:RNA polymerase sigma factor (TIGR02999 family)